MPVSTAYRAPSVGRALKILEMVAESHGGLGISDLARMLGISKGTVFGLCQQLEDHGALTRDPVSKRYGLGPLVATLAGRGFVHARLRDLAGPELSIAAGAGTRLPLTAGAVGKVFLAGMPPARLEQIMAQGLKAHTPHTVTDPQAFRQQVDQVRRQGYALERDEYLVGVWGAAAPLGAQAGLPAALWSVGFTSSLTPGRLEKIAASLRQAAQRIAQALSSPDLPG
ncbi:MAG: IclR family transcriptional regulator [Desulfarculus sp.]|nr:IclR family transcriptional regulator [Desulfarculus sp.]